MMKKQDFYKRIPILLTALFLFVLTGLVIENASASQLIWSVNSTSVSTNSITEEAEDYDYIYIAGADRGTGEWRIEKRQKSNGGVTWIQEDVYLPPVGAYSIDADDDSIYVSGAESDSGDIYWRVQRRNQVDGEIIWDKLHPGGTSLAYAVKADGNEIFVGGQGQFVSRRIEKRNKSDGEIDWYWQPNNSNARGRLYSITTDENYVYACGAWSSDKKKWLVEKRQKSDGQVMWDDELDISVVYPFIVAQSIIADENYVYVVGGDLHEDWNYWRIEKRSKANGALVWWKKVDQGGDACAYSVSADNDYLYIAGMVTDLWTIEKRNKSDGELVWIIKEDYSSKRPRSIIASCDDFLYITGDGRIEKRSKTSYVDIGLRGYDEGSGPIAIAAEPLGTLTSPLRIAKDTDDDTVPETWGIVLVDPGTSSDSGMRIKTSSGDIKALGKYSE